jgi:hypothetical protein
VKGDFLISATVLPIHPPTDNLRLTADARAVLIAHGWRAPEEEPLRVVREMADGDRL